MADLLRYFPYSEMREIQKRTLEILEKEWDRYDTFVISAPTAYGKTAVAETLIRALGSVSVITPTNLLVQQYRAEFPETCTLSRLDSYRCEEWKRPCSVTKGKLQSFCKGCPASRDLARAKYKKGPGVYNYHIYLAQKIYRDVLVVDEAHNLLPFIRDRLAQKIWQHDYGYPSNMYSTEQIRAWIETLPDHRRKHKKIQALWQSVNYPRPEYLPQRTTDQFNGKGTARGVPEERDCIKLLPVDVRDAPPMFWPGLGRGNGEVSKLILLSATIGKKDIEALGLERGGRARVLYINCESPIAASHRPIVTVPLVSVNRYSMEEATATIATYLLEVVLPQHQGQKGLVHATYQMARLLRTHLGDDPRFLFHDSGSKREVYEKFRAASPESGTVLVGSGLYEGVDLPQDLGRWQVIAKVPWQSLGSPAVKYQAEQDPEGFAWETVKTLIQACGRICRTPTDYGVTLVLDSTVDKLLLEYRHLFPAWWLDALEEGRKLL